MIQVERPQSGYSCSYIHRIVTGVLTVYCLKGMMVVMVMVWCSGREGEGVREDTKGTTHTYLATGSP